MEWKTRVGLVVVDLLYVDQKRTEEGYAQDENASIYSQL